MVFNCDAISFGQSFSHNKCHCTSLLIRLSFIAGDLQKVTNISVILFTMLLFLGAIMRWTIRPLWRGERFVLYMIIFISLTLCKKIIFKVPKQWWRRREKLSPRLKLKSVSQQPLMMSFSLASNRISAFNLFFSLAHE
mgnify:CR=1 FL=1